MFAARPFKGRGSVKGWDARLGLGTPVGAVAGGWVLTRVGACRDAARVGSEQGIGARTGLSMSEQSSYICTSSSASSSPVL